MASKLEIREIFEELDRLEQKNKETSDACMTFAEELAADARAENDSKEELLDMLKIVNREQAAVEEPVLQESEEEKSEVFSQSEKTAFWKTHMENAKEGIFRMAKSLQNRIKDRFSQTKQDVDETKEIERSGLAKFLFNTRNFAEGHKNWLLVAFAVFIAAFICMMGVFNYYMAYEYSYNGKLLGVVKDKEDVLRITGLVQDALTEDRDLQVIIDKKNDITFKRVATIGKDTHIDTSEEVLKRLTYVGDINVKGYSIKVDGKTTAIVGSKASAQKVLTSLKEDYLEESENSVVEDANFLEDVEIQPVNTDLQQLQKEEAAKETLKSGAVVKTSHKVTKNETIADLAEEYDMTESEIVAQNPGVNPKKLDVGSELKLEEDVPLVTLKSVEFITYMEATPYEVVEEKTDKLYQGEREVKTKGKKGKKLITARVVKTNGQEESREPTVTKVEKEPTAEVVLVGTTKRPPSVGDGEFIYPVKNFRLSSNFAWRWGRMHKGIDLACPTGSKVVAGDGGIVTFAGYKGSLGNVVMIDHQNGIESWYAHNSELTVKAGDKVYEGQQIALSGNTGRSTGPHVHFQININGGEAVNPLPYLKD